MSDIRLAKANRVARLLVAACLVVGPLAGAVVRAAVPTPSTASVARMVVDYGNHATATQILLIADGFLILLVPAALAATALAWSRAPFLSLIGGTLSLLGWCAIVMLAAQDALFAEAGRAIHAPGAATATAIATSWSSGSLATIYTFMFILGHLVGTAILGAALWRSRAIPHWAAALVGISMPLHLAAFLTNFKIGDVVAWMLLLVGFSVCAREILRTQSFSSDPARAQVLEPAHATA